jgi:glutamyl-tRNA synthetase
MVRVRFAPSPTGYLHIGAARTCLFNWLFARKNKGHFLLRIEDTDLARSSEMMIRVILEGLLWLGLDWDEGPEYQSQRTSLYRRKADELIQKKKAYRCYCLPEEIQARKKGKEKSWMYDRHCLLLTPGEKNSYEAEGRKWAVRFRIPDGVTRFDDLIHGPIAVDNDTIEDFVILRSDGLPTYHLSVVVDDNESGITHIIRGDDHISNTPKQILLYQAFGARPPQFAHLALILGSDKKKLSKRHGVMSVLQFKEEGYFPLAVLNFLAQMSWDPGEGERIYSTEEMVRRFSLTGLSKNNPVFDMTKLEWFNGKLISEASAKALAPFVREELKKTGLWREKLEHEKKEWFFRFIDLLKERSRTLSDFSRRGRPFLSDDFEYEQEAVEKFLEDSRLSSLIEALQKDFSALSDFSAQETEQCLRKRAAAEGVKAALLIHATRVLVLGMAVSPSLFDVLGLLGKETTVQRLRQIHRFVPVR